MHSFRRIHLFYLLHLPALIFAFGYMRNRKSLSSFSPTATS